MNEETVCDDITTKVIRQVEFYMSDGNLSRDKFFKQEMAKRQDGGIPLQLLLSCNRLKTNGVTEDILRNAIEKSAILKISSDNTCVVRIHPLLDMGPREKRTILVTGIKRWPYPINSSNNDNREKVNNCFISETINKEVSRLNIDWQLTEWIRKVFSEYGEVVYVNLPHYHTTGIYRGFGFVEFKESKSARRAVKQINSIKDTQHWFVKPLDPDICVVNECPETAWKPRLAAKSAFSYEQMLARRYIWRCCSRKNKQIQIAFRHLREAGYRAPNPCDREYDLITLGESSLEARMKYVESCYGEPCLDKLHAFRYSIWIFWREKFYVWLQAWIERMRNKTEELSISSNQLLSSMNLGNNEDTIDEIQENKVITDIVVDESIEISKKVKLKTDLQFILPKDFVNNSVVQVYWPVHLIPNDIENPTSEKTDEILLQGRQLSFARRLRISLEKNILLPCDLLNQVLYVDPCPSETLVNQVNNSDPFVIENNVSLSDFSPVFIRLKSADDASQLINFVQSISQSSKIFCRLLCGSSELAYCKYIVESRLGASERRRKSQARRRLKNKGRVSDVYMPGQTTKSEQTNSVNKMVNNPNELHKHIIFDD